MGGQRKKSALIGNHAICQLWRAKRRCSASGAHQNALIWTCHFRLTVACSGRRTFSDKYRNSIIGICWRNRSSGGYHPLKRRTRQKCRAKTTLANKCYEAQLALTLYLRNRYWEKPVYYRSIKFFCWRPAYALGASAAIFSFFGLAACAEAYIVEPNRANRSVFVVAAFARNGVSASPKCA